MIRQLSQAEQFFSVVSSALPPNWRLVAEFATDQDARTIYSPENKAVAWVEFRMWRTHGKVEVDREVRTLLRGDPVLADRPPHNAPHIARYWKHHWQQRLAEDIKRICQREDRVAALRKYSGGWRREPPDEEGWWWVHDGQDSYKPVQVYVSRIEPGEADNADPLYVWDWHNDDQQMSNEDWDLYWRCCQAEGPPDGWEASQQSESRRSE